jgi:hypothetical protein
MSGLFCGRIRLNPDFPFGKSGQQKARLLRAGQAELEAMISNLPNGNFRLKLRVFWPAMATNSGPLVVLYAMGHMRCSHVFLRGGVNVFHLVIKKYVGAERLQKCALVAPAQKQRLVDAYTPITQRQNHPFVRRRRAGGYQGSADW